MVKAGHNLNVYCVRLSNSTPFCGNYEELYFDAKHSEKGLNSGVGLKFLEPFFYKKCSLCSILNAALNFQNMPCKCKNALGQSDCRIVKLLYLKNTWRCKVEFLPAGTYLLKVHQCRFENLSIFLCPCKNNTLKILHSES